MNLESRRLILQFMRLTLYQFHPNFDEYPIENMKRAEYEHRHDLLQAYYMYQAIEGLENN